MIEKIKSSLLCMLKGVIAPCITLFAFSLTIGLFLSLTLLVVSIEEGTGNLSDSAMSMTWAVLMFAQGVGITFGNCVLTIIPLGLTLLLLSVLVALIRRIKGGILAYSTGFAVWIAANAVLSQNTHVTLVDSLLVIIVKCACIYVIALAIALLPKSRFSEVCKKRYQQIFPSWAQKNIRITVRAAIIVFSLYAVVAIVTVVVWSFTHIGSVNSFFLKLGMQNGSRILTTIACLVWLPNVAIWALSWICGAGFAIGKVAYFSLSAAQYKALPPVPVFGIFPESINDCVYRILFNSLIPTVCAVVVLVIILHKRGCALQLHDIKDSVDRKTFMVNVAQSAGDCIGIAAIITVVCSVVFSFANGSLGEYRLAHIGVDIIESTRAVGHLTLYAVGIAWGLAIIGSFFACGVRYLIGLLPYGKSSHKDEDPQNNKSSLSEQSSERTLQKETKEAETKIERNQSAARSKSVSHSKSALDEIQELPPITSHSSVNTTTAEIITATNIATNVATNAATQPSDDSKETPTRQSKAIPATDSHVSATPTASTSHDLPTQPNLRTQKFEALRKQSAAALETLSTLTDTCKPAAKRVYRKANKITRTIAHGFTNGLKASVQAVKNVAVSNTTKATKQSDTVSHNATVRRASSHVDTKSAHTTKRVATAVRSLKSAAHDSTHSLSKAVGDSEQKISPLSLKKTASKPRTVSSKAKRK